VILLPPRVLGPISTASRAVRVVHQLAGFKVTVLVNGVGAGSAVVSSPDAMITLDRSVPLRRGDEIRAFVSAPSLAERVDYPADSSPSPEPVYVQSVGDALGPVAIATPLSASLVAARIVGAVPGARVGLDRGSTTYWEEAFDGTAQVRFVGGLAVGEQFDVRHELAGLPATVTRSPRSMGRSVQRAGIEIVGPLLERATSLKVRSVRPGGLVEILELSTHVPPRDVTLGLVHCADSEAVVSVAPLAFDARIVARERYREPVSGSESGSYDESAVVVAQDLHFLPPPTVVGPIFSGGTSVRLRGLIAGARVQLLRDGIDIGHFEARDTDEFVQVGAPLAAGEISAQQAIVSPSLSWSVPSPPVSVTPAYAPRPLRLASPQLFATADCVGVQGSVPNALVIVRSERLGEIGRAHAIDDEVDIRVAPLLVTDDDIYITQRIGTFESDPAVATVLPRPVGRLAPPRVFAVSGTRAIVARDVVPGARVDVLIDGSLEGSGAAVSSVVDVRTSIELSSVHSVAARQRLPGDEDNPFSASVPVIAPTECIVTYEAMTTRKVCQLTGETDGERGVPTASQTQRVGIGGTDLGASVLHDGRLWFFFGDVLPSFAPVGVPDSDPLYRLHFAAKAVATSRDTNPEDPLNLTFFTEPVVPADVRVADVFRPLSIGVATTFGLNNAATGAFSLGDHLYVFAAIDWTRDRPEPPRVGRSFLCRLAYSALPDPLPAPPLSLSVVPIGGVAEFSHAGGHFLIAWPVVVDATMVVGLPLGSASRGVLFFGTGPFYRSGRLYLAFMPVRSDGSFGERWFLRGIGVGGSPDWRREGDAGTTELSTFAIVDDHFGELSVHWNPQLRKWILLYQSNPFDSALGEWGGTDHGSPGRGIRMRYADVPWGPWSPPTIVFDPADAYCRFMHSLAACDGLPNPEYPTPGLAPAGGEYAPYVISSFGSGSGSRAKLYFAMGTFNPYEVVFMRTRLRLLPRSG